MRCLQADFFTCSVASYSNSPRPDSLSAGPCSEKKCGAPSPIFSSKKSGDLFLLIAVVHSGESPIISLFRACKKFPAPFVGAPFCEAPVRLNMRKSAAVTHSVSARPRLGLVNTALGSAWRVNKTYNKVSKLQSTSV